MAELRITEVARQLDCSVQSIYQKKKYLLDNGMARFDEKEKLFKINESGLNYLRGKREKYITIQSTNKQEEIQEEHTQSNNSVYEKQIELLERIIDSKEKEIDRLYKELQGYKEQNMELILNQRLFLPQANIDKIFNDSNSRTTNEENIENKEKRGFFSRLFK